MLAGPDPRPELDLVEPYLFRELADDRLLVRLAGIQPAAGRRPHDCARKLEANEQDPVVRIEDDRARSLAQPHSDSRNAWNHRSRSAHGTAAFAGEVDGSTQSAVSPRRRSCAPSSARSPNAPR